MVEEIGLVVSVPPFGGLSTASVAKGRLSKGDVSIVASINLGVKIGNNWERVLGQSKVSDGGSLDISWNAAPSWKGKKWVHLGWDRFAHKSVDCGDTGLDGADVNRGELVLDSISESLKLGLPGGPVGVEVVSIAAGSVGSVPVAGAEVSLRNSGTGCGKNSVLDLGLNVGGTFSAAVLERAGNE